MRWQVTITRTALLVTTPVVLCCGCATMLFSGALSTLTYEPLQQARLPVRTTLINAPHERVFQSCLTVLRSQGYQIKTQSPEQGVIETEFKPSTSGGARAASAMLTGVKGFSDAWLVEVRDRNHQSEMTLRLIVRGELAVGKPTYEYRMAQAVFEQRSPELLRAILDQVNGEFLVHQSPQ